MSVKVAMTEVRTDTPTTEKAEMAKVVITEKVTKDVVMNDIFSVFHFPKNTKI